MASPTWRGASEGTLGSLAIGLLAGAAAVAIGTAAGLLILDRRLTDVVMLYLLGVVAVAMRFGYAPSLFTTAASVAAFDFFFVTPYFSFAVADRRYVVTFAIMFFVAFVISNRTERIRRIASAARHREVRTAALYAMSRELAVARSSDEMTRVAYRHLHDVFHSDVCLLLPDEGGALRRDGQLVRGCRAELVDKSFPEDGVSWQERLARPIGKAFESAASGRVAIDIEQGLDDWWAIQRPRIAHTASTSRISSP